MPGKVGVPGVRMHEIDFRDGHRHLQIDAESLNGLVGSMQRSWHWVRSGVDAMPSEAVHIHGGESAKLMHELIDVDAGAAVDLRWPFASQNSNAHQMSIGM